MAKTARTADFREKILKEGLLKHRQTSLSLPRWRGRYVVFKVTNSGRLQFLVYKEQPTIPANEMKEIPIEEFGGLEANLKLDSEKCVFAIVTTQVTDCFATDTPEEMHEWVRLLQEYLGKEMVLNITIPFKQNLLKSGKAQLRIRNTSFTVTTCDNPPRCQGTWQIVHIRKFGGSDSFRFQTGSKCPSGEYLYTINTEDNSRIKILFNDLSQHKPIFTDDRLGRRMTIERKHHARDTLPAIPTQISSHPKAANRYSLQSASSSSRSNQSHIYENRPAITEMPAQVTADLVKAGVSPPMGRRHSAVDGQIFNPKTHSAIVKANGSPRTSRSIEDLTYQNIHRSSPYSGRRSPQKKTSSGVRPEELPEGYYNVSPPLALKKYRLSNSSSSPPPANSPSSPEEGSPPHGSEFRRTTPPIGEEEAEYCEGYVKFTPSTVLEGDSLIVKRSSGGSERFMNGSATSPPGQVYQNLEFMRGTSADEGDKHRNATPLAQLPPVADPDFPPLYTNVEFARESVHGRTMKAGSPHRSFPKEGMQPGRRKDRTPTPNHPLPPRNTHRTIPLSPTKLTAQSRLRISHSNFELQSNSNRSSDAGRSQSPPANYYNHFARDLPANNPLSGITTTTQSQLERVQSPTGRDEREMSPLSPNKEGYARLARNEKLPSSRNPLLPGYASVDEMQKMVVVDDPEDPEAPGGTNSLGRYIPSYYDRLEIKSPSNSPCFSPVPTDRTISPRPGCYDTLAPIENGTSSSQKPIYGLLQRLEDSKSSSSSPEPTTLPPSVIHSRTMVYQKKVALLGHGHNYESVDVGVEGVDLGDVDRRTPSGDERSMSPEGKENPLDWLSPVSDSEAFSFSEQDKESMIESAQKLRKSSKSPNTRSRRKPLPLQSVSFSKDQDDSCDETPPAIPPKRSKSPIVTSTETKVNSPKSPRKPAPLPRSVRLQSTESGSGDFLSSTEEVNSSKRQSTLSTASTSSVDSDKGQSLFPNTPERPRRTPSPSREDSHESASLKPNRILSVSVETVKSNSDGDKVPSPKPRHRMITSEKSDSSDEFSPPQMVTNPPLPPRNNSTKQRDARTKETFPMSLPYTHVDFNPPIRPPKPKILTQQEQSLQQYAVVSFDQSSSPKDDMYSSVFTSVPLPSVGKNYSKSKSGSVNSDRGNYASIDHTMTRELGKMKEEVEDQRSRERKFIKDNKNS